MKTQKEVQFLILVTQNLHLLLLHAEIIPWKAFLTTAETCASSTNKLALTGFILCEAETLDEVRSLPSRDCGPATQHHQSAEQWSVCSDRITEWFGLQETFKGHLL